MREQEVINILRNLWLKDETSVDEAIALEYSIRLVSREIDSKKTKEKDNITNGEVIKALFPNVKTRDYDNSGDFITYTFDGIVGNAVEKSWWNAPYKPPYKLESER